MNEDISIEIAELPKEEPQPPTFNDQIVNQQPETADVTGIKLEGLENSELDFTGVELFGGDFLRSKLERDIVKELENYDVHKIPPKMEDAMTHRICCNFGQKHENMEVEKIKICPCCCNIESMPYYMSIDTEDLEICGPVIPLFFQFTKSLTVLCLIMCLFAAVGQYYIIKANCAVGSKFEGCGYNIKTLVSSYNRDLLDKPDYVKFISYFVEIPVLILMTIFFYNIHKRAIKLKEKIDKGMITASDYTVMMYDIAPENESLEYIQNYIDQILFRSAKVPAKIVKLNIGKFEGNYARLIKEKHDVTSAFKSIQEHVEKNKDKLSNVLKTGLELKLKMLDNTKRSLEKKILAYSDRIKKNPGFAQNSIAFISFRFMAQAESLFEMDSATTKTRWILSKMLPCFTGRVKFHYLKQAPEPDDVKWKFIGFSPIQRFFTYMNSYIVTFFAICVSFGIQMGVRILQFIIIKALNGNNPSLFKRCQIFGLTILSSLLLAVTNIVLASISMKMSRYEKHLSHSMFTLSHTRKLIVLQFINTVGIVIGLTYVPAHLGGITNFSETVFINMLTNLVLNPLLHAFDPSHLARLLKQYTVKKKMEKDKYFSEMTQKELNELFEPADLTIYLRYTSVIRTFFVSCFFFHVVPSGMFICLIFLIIQFWVDKYMILRRYKITTRYHHNLSYELNEFCEKSILLVALGHLMIKYNIRKEFFIVDILSVVFAVIIIFNPVFEYARHKVNQEMELRQSYKNENMNNSDGQGQHR